MKCIHEVIFTFLIYIQQKDGYTVSSARTQKGDNDKELTPFWFLANNVCMVCSLTLQKQYIRFAGLLLFKIQYLNHRTEKQMKKITKGHL